MIRPIKSKKLDKLDNLEHLPVMANMGIKSRYPFRQKGISIPKETAQITIAPNTRIIPYDRNGEKNPQILEESLTQNALVWGVFVGNPRTLIYSPIEGDLCRSNRDLRNTRTIYLVSTQEVISYRVIT